ncbi:MAG: nucleotide exchange factor GrpE [Candidatus Neomarinimicrobiota bacterium]|nr:MAG: nucleotide exchange factor GrpE [Candidatus Neomarinimicrobiota bacterium]
MSAEKKTATAKKTTKAKTGTPRKKTTASRDKKVIKELTEALAKAEEKALRIRAEFENFRRRKEKEIQKILDYNGEQILRDLLPIVDDLDRLSEAARTGDGKANLDALLEGVDLIKKRLGKKFEEWEVVPFAEPGEPLDPELHDAMMVQNDPEQEDNTILQVFEKGYRYKDRVLRHAKVIVNKK